jgi:glycosyltransferase involved in cell wall biosynthesis
VNPRVLIAYKSLPRYRLAFFERLRERLEGDGIDLDLAYGQGTPKDAARGESAQLAWGKPRRNRVLRIGRRELVWQQCLADSRRSQLVIVEQASRLLVNYVLLGRQTLSSGPVAFWGHGANLQLHTASPASEWLKRRVSRLPHWWFAYTEGSRRRVESLGYPPERITVVQNAQDTEHLSAAVAAVTEAERQRFRAEHDLGAGPVGLFLGSLSREKRLDFLLEAAGRIRDREPEFRLLIAGAGEDGTLAEAAAADHPWVRYLGRVDGLRSKATLLSVADALLVPGLIGLVALDSFAAGVPLVTTAIDFHSPEIEYVQDGVNGVIAPEPEDADAYCGLALETMARSPFRDRLLVGCREAAATFTLAAMVDRFAGGVHAALEAR